MTDTGMEERVGQQRDWIEMVRDDTNDSEQLRGAVFAPISVNGEARERHSHCQQEKCGVWTSYRQIVTGVRQYHVLLLYSHFDISFAPYFIQDSVYKRIRRYAFGFALEVHDQPMA